MPEAAIPTQAVHYVSLGIADVLVNNPVLFLKVNGITYSNGYKFYDGNSSYRNFFPVYNEATGEVRLYCQTVNFGNTVPAITLTNIEVHLAN